MGRSKKDGNHCQSPKIIEYMIQKEMKKMDSQLQTPTK
jgi:hypothetical protein